MSPQLTIWCLFGLAAAVLAFAVLRERWRARRNWGNPMSREQLIRELRRRRKSGS